MYLSTGETTYLAMTFPSKDFVRIQNAQESQAMATFGQDPLTWGLTPTNIGKTYPNTPVAYAQTVYLWWQNALAEGEKKWGNGAFPDATKGLAKAYAAMTGNAHRTMLGSKAYLGKQLDGPEAKNFWDGIDLMGVRLASKDYSVTQEEKWAAFLSGAKDGAKNVLDIAKSATDSISKPLFAMADIVRWSVIGGIALAGWYYVVRPAYSAYQTKKRVHL